jgi:hypothetical protein
VLIASRKRAVGKKERRNCCDCEGSYSCFHDRHSVRLILRGLCRFTTKRKAKPFDGRSSDVRAKANFPRQSWEEYEHRVIHHQDPAT